MNPKIRVLTLGAAKWFHLMWLLFDIIIYINKFRKLNLFTKITHIFCVFVKSNRQRDVNFCAGDPWQKLAFNSAHEVKIISSKF